MFCAAWGWLTLQAACRLAAAATTLETLTGTSPEYVVTSWQMQQGLPSDRVRAVLQTRDGYIWIASFNGAAQFDGVRFRVFNEANTPAFRNSLVSCLFEDAQGRLWFGSDTGEITWRDGGGFHALRVPNDWPSFRVDRFVESPDGTVWVLNREGFILAIRGLEVQGVLGHQSGPLYSDIVRDEAGQVWAVRYGGVIVGLAGARGDGGRCPRAGRKLSDDCGGPPGRAVGEEWIPVTAVAPGEMGGGPGRPRLGGTAGGGVVRGLQRRGVGGDPRGGRLCGSRRRLGAARQSRDRAGP